MAEVETVVGEIVPKAEEATITVVSEHAAKLGRQQALHNLAAMHVSIGDVALCLQTMSLICTQGGFSEDRTNVEKRGGIAVGLRRAAWRVENGTFNGFSESEEARKGPQVNLRAIADAAATLQSFLEAATHETTEEERISMSEAEYVDPVGHLGLADKVRLAVGLARALRELIDPKLKKPKTMGD